MKFDFITMHKMKFTTYDNVVRKLNKSGIVLVNDQHPIDENKRIDLIRIFDKQFISYEAYRPFMNMFTEMKKQGLKPFVCSSYRSIEKQEDLFKSKCQHYLTKGYSQKDAENLASTWVARPYCSEHHTGLALDIVSDDYRCLDENQEHTKEQQWLMKNSWKYGFILRYPRHGMDMTHVHYEPWHYRYVGKDIAKIIYKREITLEEYLNE